MEDKKCACKGVKLVRDMVNAYIQYAPEDIPLMKKLAPKMDKIAQNMFDHISTQANKKENGQLRAQVEADLDTIRGDLKKYATTNKYADTPVIQGMEIMRDKIHKNPAMKQLLVCGGPGAQEETAQMLELVWNIMAGEVWENPDNHGDGRLEIEDALPVLDGIEEILSCEGV